MPVALWGALFAAVAGYVDAICFFLLAGDFGAGMRGAFAANMTGNLVELGINTAQGYQARAAWLGGILLSFFGGVLIAQSLLKAGASSRSLLLVEAFLVALAAVASLGLAEVPVLATAMAIQNQAARHAGFDVDVGFVTGDIQLLGRHAIHAIAPSGPRPEGRPRVILAVLVFYAVGAAIGTLSTDAGEAVLGFVAAAIVGIALAPARWTGIRDRH